MKYSKKCFPNQFIGLAWILDNTNLCQIIFYYFKIENFSLCSGNQKLNS